MPDFVPALFVGLLFGFVFGRLWQAAVAADRRNDG